MKKDFQREIVRNVSASYLLYLPENYNDKDKFPLMLFLHGRGESGNDLELVKRHGLPKLINEGKKFPFIVVSPQMPKDHYWSVDVLDGLLHEIVENYKVDEKRIYVTGLSRGGHGTWRLAMAFPNRFAAIAPVCGWGDARIACLIKDVPVWVFHGAKDKTVPVSESERMVEALKECNGNVRFTVYPEADHDSWTETYNNPELYEWLLKHSLK